MYKRSVIAGLMAMASFAMVGCGGGSDTVASPAPVDPNKPLPESEVVKMMVDQWGVNSDHATEVCATPGVSCFVLHNLGPWLVYEEESGKEKLALIFDPKLEGKGVRVSVPVSTDKVGDVTTTTTFSNEIDSVVLDSVNANIFINFVFADYKLDYDLAYHMTNTQEVLVVDVSPELGGYTFHMPAEVSVAIGGLLVEAINNN